jgi:hypothetical protein
LLDLHEFRGVGNVENWEGYYPGGILEWFSHPKGGEATPRNPYDLLSVCFMTQLNKKKMTKH